MVERTLKALADSFQEPWWRREKELIKTIKRLEEELSHAQEVPNDLGEALRAEKKRVLDLERQLREEKLQREAYEDWIIAKDTWADFSEWLEQAKKEEGAEVVKLGPPPCKERDAKGQRCIYLDGHGGDCDGGKPTNPCHSNYGVQWRQGKGGGEWICVRCDKVIKKAEEK